MFKKIKFKIIYGLLICCTLFILILSCLMIGSTNISLKYIINIFMNNIPIIKQYITIKEYPLYIETIILSVRLPRILTSLLVGASLSMIGTTYQGLMKNSMADPYVIGVSSGAALGASISIIFNFDYLYSITLSFIGSLISLCFIYKISTKNGMISTYSLLLGGVAISSLFSAITSFLMILDKQNTQTIVFWMLGSFSGSCWKSLNLIFIPVVFGLSSLMLFSKDLNAIIFGEESAISLGIDINKTKKIILVISSIVIGSSVSVSGPIGFIGLIIPHISRLIFGPDHRKLLPMSAFIGACFTLIADTISRTIISPIEIPIGIITAFCGAPFFIYLLRKKYVRSF